MQKLANAILKTILSPTVHTPYRRTPEEVTDMNVHAGGEVISSTFDEPPERHVQLAEMVIRKQTDDRAQADVVILLDSITRLARPTTRPTALRQDPLGGVDANACIAKTIFGAR